jgi:hypothetical protein
LGREKQVQIPRRLLNDIRDVLEIVLSASDGVDGNETTLNAIEDILSEIDARRDAFVRRTLYSAYKTSERGSDRREFFRKEYLEKSGIRPDFISVSEVEI